MARLELLLTQSWTNEFLARVCRTGERDPEYHIALKELEEEVAVQAETVPKGRKAKEEVAVLLHPSRMG